MKYSEETVLDQRSAGMNSHTSGLLCILWQSPALSGLQIPMCQMQDCGRTISKD